MKTIGMLGGMSWESSRLYYEMINREVQKRLGGVHSAKLLLWSFDLAEMLELLRAGRGDKISACMAEAASALARAGADFLVIACNTMHIAAEQVEAASGIPLLHIADPLGEKLKSDGIFRAGLLGSCFTVEDDRIITGRLASRYGIEPVAPDKRDTAEIDRIIMEELARGRFLDSSRTRCREIVTRLVARGAEAVILGCTELPLLLQPEHSSVPLYDTSALHALAAVDYALA